MEARPHEKGRQVVVVLGEDGTPKDASPADSNVRTRVHEYGGGSFVTIGDTLYYSNFADQRLYRHKMASGNPPVAISPEKYFFANGEVDARRKAIYYVREDHTSADPHVQPPAAIVRVSLEGDEGSPGVVLAEGFDFFSSPTLSPKGDELAYICWNHPNMPWDDTSLFVLKLDEAGNVVDKKKIRGFIPEAVTQPRYSPGGKLHFITDETGFWNIHRLEEDGTVTNVGKLDYDFDAPAWTFGHASYQFLSEHRILAFYKDGAVNRLIVIDTESGGITAVENLGYSIISSISPPSENGEIISVVSSPSQPSCVFAFKLSADGKVEGGRVLARSSSVEIDPGFISCPTKISFPSEGGRTSYALFYPPHNKDFAAPPSALPPLIVLTHGGPTASASAEFNLKIQFWTSRGFAVADVDYGGSSGYGRAYRDLLKGNWGIVDVEDSCACVQYLASSGLVDGNRTAIEGGSAGGYTTLACLAFKPTVFKAGCSHYGVGNLESLAAETHKFESKYLDMLIGPYPEEKQKYFERSPANFIQNFCVPMALFHGVEDKIVPPQQSVDLHVALKAKGVPVLLQLLEGEQHGFRQSHNIIKVLQSQLYFYSRVFAFEPADTIEPVEIDNMA